MLHGVKREGDEGGRARVHERADHVSVEWMHVESIHRDIVITFSLSEKICCQSVSVVL